MTYPANAPAGYCRDCKQFNECKTPCKEVLDYLKRGNRVFEKNGMVFPVHKSVQFCELPQFVIEQFSQDDRVQFNTDKVQLRKTAIFVDRVFNGLSNDEMARKYGISEGTVRSLFQKTLARLQEFISAMDVRREGIKHIRKRKHEFNRSEQFFLLHQVFGFGIQEIARMFQVHRSVVENRVHPMAERFRQLFDGITVEEKQVQPIIAGQELLDAVHGLQDQGHGRIEAMRILAGQRGENFQALKKRYYTTARRFGHAFTA